MRIGTWYFSMEAWLKAVLAGLMISLGGIVYLKVGGVIGAALFSVGLLGVVSYGFPLFTGRAGFTRMTPPGWTEMWLMLCLNVVGTAFGAILASGSCPELSAKAFEIIQTKTQAGLWRAFYAAFGCGVLMSLAVYGYTTHKSYVPMLFAVPCFILSGFYHCVADSFYFMLSMQKTDTPVNLAWLAVFAVTVVGNWLGCNVQRLVGVKAKY